MQQASSTTLAKNFITLVCGADDRFAMPMAVTLFSALVNLSESCGANIFILDGGITASNRQRINNVLNRTHRNYTVNWIVHDLGGDVVFKETPHISKAAYLRIFIPDLLPQHIDKAIYLDCDMLVLGDLKVLNSIPFDGAPALGVQDYWQPYTSTEGNLALFKKIAFDADVPYCNSGLLVMDLARWRLEKISKQLVDFLGSHPNELRFYDQDALNAVLGKQWKLVDPRWNVSLSSVAEYGRGLNMDAAEVNTRRQEITAAPFIIHFTSRHKPWHSGYGSKEALCTFYFDQRFIKQYRYYLKRTGWFSATRFFVWNNWRRAVLLFGYKLPRRMGWLRPVLVTTSTEIGTQHTQAA